MLRWTLVLLDLFVLLAFSYGGMAFHETGGSPVAELLRIAWPFLLGYFVVALPLRAHERPRSGYTFARRSALAWLLGMGLGFLLRGLQRGYLPDGMFIAIALGFTGILGALTRGLYWWLGSGGRDELH